MATRTSDAQGVMTGKPLIESDRVEGTTVYDRSGNNIGSASEVPRNAERLPVIRAAIRCKVRPAPHL